MAVSSQRELAGLSDRLDLSFEQSDGGLLLLRTDREVARVGKAIAAAAGQRGAFELLDVSACRALEPALCRDLPLRGAVRLPSGRVGNGRRTPVIGHSGQTGLWLNVGHGPHGWALACGAATLLADLLAGRPVPPDLAWLGIGRWQ